ncbi:ankyrin [Anaeromyces robustus]|uniref:Ankyrin n=1 Tax=Anaeromyces robustus TaxID=1754192 RepID=A0A1Y1X2T4_9FUNG|nr:ankyrin [Anaeromyces robustus]|eukprot:ORX80117.1 ankyrin [Anaeromyces robustus]
MSTIVDIENIRDNVIEFIKNNNITDLKLYIDIYNINLKEINSEEFDILIYAIENEVSLEIIHYLIIKCQYNNLNYSFYCDKGYRKYSFLEVGQDICYRGYKVPLFSAIAKKRFRIANLLIKYKADINYRLDILCWEDIHIIHYLYHIHRSFFDNDILIYILIQGFNIKNLTTSLMTYLNNTCLNGLTIIFKYCIFDISFILKMLNFYKNKTILSCQQLQEIIKKEKYKIKIDKSCYNEVLYPKRNYDILKLFFDHDNYDNHCSCLSSCECYELLQESIYYNNYNLVQSILNFVIFNGKNNLEFFLIDVSKGENKEIIKIIEDLLIQCIEVGNFNILQLVLETFLLNFVLRVRFIDFFKNIHIEKLLLEAGKENRNDPKILNLLLQLLFVISLIVKENRLVGNSNESLQSIKTRFSNKYIYQTSFKDIENLAYYLIIMKYDTSYLNLVLNTLIKLNYIDELKYLVNECNEFKSRINFNTMDMNDDCPLMVAFYKDNIEIFQYLLENGGDYNLKLKKKEFCHHDRYIAYINNDEEKDVEEENEDEDNYNEEEETKSIFSLALQLKKYRIIRCLLKYPIQIDENEFYSNQNKNYNNYSLPIIHSIFNNNIDEIKSYINDKNYDSDDDNHHHHHYHNYNNFLNKEWGITPLVAAYLLNKKDIFNILIDYYDINELDNYGYNILHYSILKEDITVINDLISRGANINFYDNSNGHGHCTLDIVIHIKNQMFFSILIQQENILLNIPNEQGDTPLITLLKYHWNLDYNLEEVMDWLKILIEKDVDVNLIDKNGYSPLAYAIQTNFLSLVKLLIDNGSNINYKIKIHSNDYKDDREQSILYFTIKLGYKDLIKYLIECNASIDLTNDDEIFYLICFTKWSDTELFEYFIKYNFNSLTFKFLEKIIYWNRLDLLKIIVEKYHLDINMMKDSQGQTLLTCAIKYNKKQISNYLIKNDIENY